MLFDRFFFGGVSDLMASNWIDGPRLLCRTIKQLARLREVRRLIRKATSSK